MKKTLAILVLVALLATNAFAYSYSNDPSSSYGGYNYGGYNNYGYCTGMRQYLSTANYSASPWFANSYGERYGVEFHVYPTSNINRSEVFAAVGKAMDKAYSEAGNTFSSSYGVPFKDYTWDSSLNRIAGGLYRRGIMVGYPDNTVRYSNYITRGEFAKVLVLVAKENGLNMYSNTSIYNTFADTTNHWAAQYAAQANAMGLMVGVSNNMFAPNEYVTYEQFVIIMLRIAEQSNSSRYSADTDDMAYGVSTTSDIDFEGYDYGRMNRIDDITVVGSQTVYCQVGDTVNLKVKASPSDIDLNDNDIEWVSAKTSYLRYSSSTADGRYAEAKFKALKEGTVKVTATSSYDENVDVIFTVVIGDNIYESGYVTSITANPSSVNLNIGGSQEVTLTVLPSNANDKSVTWASDNTAVATVDQNGNITGRGVGTATVTATANDGSGIVARIYVTVSAGQVSDSNKPQVYLLNESGSTASVQGKVNEDIVLYVEAQDENLANFNVDASSVSGTDGLTLTTEKVSDTKYKVVIKSQFVATFYLRVNEGVATDVSGNASASSNELEVFVNA